MKFYKMLRNSKKLGKRNPVHRIEEAAKRLIEAAGIKEYVKVFESCKPPHIYGLPKIHKPNVPLRPVVSCIGTTLHPLAKYLVRVINPLQENIASNVQNSGDFVSKIRNVEMIATTKMVSFDVTSLFTNVPVVEALDCLKQKLNQDQRLSNRTPLTVDQIVELTRYCVTNTIFQYKQDFYSQIDGMAMGSPLSPVMCNLFMESFEQEAIQKAALKPRLWLRYVDDTFILWDYGDETLREFLEYLNSVNNAIKFTMEVEEDLQLPFLDVLVQKKSNGLATTVYRKKTHTDRYLNYLSNHAEKTKIGVVKCLQKRAEAICSSEKALTEEQEKIKNAFLQNGYPENVIKKAHKTRIPSTQSLQPVVTATIPYSGKTSEIIKRICRKYNVRVACHSRDTLRKRLNKVTPLQPSENKRNVVYQIPMEPCNRVYIGETGQPLKKRMGQHKSACKTCKPERSSVAEHILSCKCGVNWDNITVLATEQNQFKRKIRESIEMEKAGYINYGAKSHQLSTVWSKEFLIRHSASRIKSIDNQQ
jgi:Reverse transcriptase (RNA-dependent DNA polymerase)